MFHDVPENQLGIQEPLSPLQVRHCATFPGLAVLCATPGIAYLSLDALDGTPWAALGKWRGEAVEVFRHPKGRGSSSTQG